VGFLLFHRESIRPSVRGWHRRWVSVCPIILMQTVEWVSEDKEHDMLIDETVKLMRLRILMSTT